MQGGVTWTEEAHAGMYSVSTLDGEAYLEVSLGTFLEVAFEHWRRDWDSNPGTLWVSGFQDRSAASRAVSR